MKKSFSALVVALLINTCFANDIIVKGPAKTLFNSSYNLGGDRYCKRTKCSLSTHCVFDRLGGPDDAKYQCEINGEIVLDAESSESLFRDILEASETIDEKCSANFCELSANCIYSHFIFSKYKCEIF